MVVMRKTEDCDKDGGDYITRSCVRPRHQSCPPQLGAPTVPRAHWRCGCCGWQQQVLPSGMGPCFQPRVDIQKDVENPWLVRLV